MCPTMTGTKTRLADEVCLRYVYMIDVDNRGDKSKFFGLRKILYAGQTINIKRRFIEHLKGQNSNYLRNCFPNSQKKLVYVEYVWGNEYDAILREKQIKKCSTLKKRQMLDSDDNVLVCYKPLQAIILKKFGSRDEHVGIRL